MYPFPSLRSLPILILALYYVIAECKADPNFVFTYEQEQTCTNTFYKKDSAYFLEMCKLAASKDYHEWEYDLEKSFEKLSCEKLPTVLYSTETDSDKSHSQNLLVCSIILNDNRETRVDIALGKAFPNDIVKYIFNQEKSAWVPSIIYLNFLDMVEKRLTHNTIFTYEQEQICRNTFYTKDDSYLLEMCKTAARSVGYSDSQYIVAEWSCDKLSTVLYSTKKKRDVLKEQHLLMCSIILKFNEEKVEIVLGKGFNKTNDVVKYIFNKGKKAWEPNAVYGGFLNKLDVIRL